MNPFGVLAAAIADLVSKLQGAADDAWGLEATWEDVLDLADLYTATVSKAYDWEGTEPGITDDLADLWRDWLEGAEKDGELNTERDAWDVLYTAARMQGMSDLQGYDELVEAFKNAYLGNLATPEEPGPLEDAADALGKLGGGFQVASNVGIGLLALIATLFLSLQ